MTRHQNPGHPNSGGPPVRPSVLARTLVTTEVCDGTTRSICRVKGVGGGSGRDETRMTDKFGLRTEPGPCSVDGLGPLVVTSGTSRPYFPRRQSGKGWPRKTYYYDSSQPPSSTKTNGPSYNSTHRPSPSETNLKRVKIRD